MIKGIDAQVMTNRAAEYSKDVSSQLRQDTLRNEFASRLNQLETEQEMHSVSEMEEMRGTRVNADDEGGNGGAGSQDKENKRRRKKQDEDLLLPSVGKGEQRLLDIEV